MNNDILNVNRNNVFRFGFMTRFNHYQRQTLHNYSMR